MVLSTFSQISFVHLFCNMFALKGFGEGVVESLGKEQTLALYLSAGKHNIPFKNYTTVSKAIFTEILYNLTSG